VNCRAFLEHYLFHFMFSIFLFPVVLILMVLVFLTVDSCRGACILLAVGAVEMTIDDDDDNDVLSM